MAGEKDKLYNNVNPLIDFTKVIQVGQEMNKSLDAFQLADLLKSYKDEQGVSTQFVLNESTLKDLNPASQKAIKDLYKNTQQAYSLYEKNNAFPTNGYKFGSNEILSTFYPNLNTAKNKKLDDVGLEFFWNGDFIPGRQFHREEIADVAPMYLDSASNQIKSLDKDKLANLTDGWDIKNVDPFQLAKETASLVYAPFTLTADALGITEGSFFDAAKAIKAAGFTGPKLTLSTYGDIAALNTEEGIKAQQLINTGVVKADTNYKVKGENNVDYYMWKTMTDKDNSFQKSVRSTWGPQTYLNEGGFMGNASELLQASNDALIGGLGTLNFAAYIPKKAVGLTSKYLGNGAYDKQIEDEYNAYNAWSESRLSTKAEISDAESVFESPINLAKGVVDGAMQLVMTMGVGGVGKLTTNGLIKAAPKIFTTNAGKELTVAGQFITKHLIATPAQAFGSVYAASAANKEARKSGLSAESALLMSALAGSTVMLTEKMTGGNWANKLIGKDLAQTYGGKIVTDVTNDVMRANGLNSIAKISPAMIKDAMGKSRTREILTKISNALEEDATNIFAAAGQGFLKEGIQETAEDSINKGFQYGFNGIADALKASGYDWIDDKERYKLEEGNLFEELATSFVVGGLVGSGAGAATYKPTSPDQMSNKIDDSKAYWLVDVALKGEAERKQFYSDLEKARKKGLLGISALSAELDEDKESKKIFGFGKKAAKINFEEVDDNEFHYKVMKDKADQIFKDVDDLKTMSGVSEQVAQTKLFANAVAKTLGLYDNSEGDIEKSRDPLTPVISAQNSQLVTLKDKEGNLIVISQEEYDARTADTSFDTLLENYQKLSPEEAAKEQEDLLSKSIEQGFSSEVIHVKSQLERANNTLASLLFVGDEGTEFQDINPKDIVSINSKLKAIKKAGDIFFSPQIKQEYGNAIERVKAVQSNVAIQQEIKLQKDTRNEIQKINFKLKRETDSLAKDTLKGEIESKKQLLLDSDAKIKQELVTMFQGNVDDAKLNTAVQSLKVVDDYKDYLNNALTKRLDYYKRKSALSGSTIERFNFFVSQGIQKQSIKVGDISPYAEDEREKRKQYFIEHTKKDQEVRAEIAKENTQEVNALVTKLRDSLNTPTQAQVIKEFTEYFATKNAAKVTDAFDEAVKEISDVSSRDKLKKQLEDIVKHIRVGKNTSFDSIFKASTTGQNTVEDRHVDTFITASLDPDDYNRKNITDTLNPEAEEYINTLRRLTTELITSIKEIDIDTVDNAKTSVTSTTSIKLPLILESIDTISNNLKGLDYQDKVKKLVELGLLSSFDIDGNATSNPNDVILGWTNNRPLVFLNFGGQIVPFYRSSKGTSGKEAGKWYPIFGFGDEGWLIKGSVDQMEEGYGNPIFRKISELLTKELNYDAALDKQIGTLSNFHPLFKNNAKALPPEAINYVVHGKSELLDIDAYGKGVDKDIKTKKLNEWLESWQKYLATVNTVDTDIEEQKVEIEKRRQEEIEMPSGGKLASKYLPQIKETILTGNNIVNRNNNVIGIVNSATQLLDGTQVRLLKEENRELQDIDNALTFGDINREEASKKRKDVYRKVFQRALDTQEIGTVINETNDQINTKYDLELQELKNTSSTKESKISKETKDTVKSIVEIFKKVDSTNLEQVREASVALNNILFNLDPEEATNVLDVLKSISPKFTTLLDSKTRYVRDIDEEYAKLSEKFIENAKNPNADDYDYLETLDSLQDIVIILQENYNAQKLIELGKLIKAKVTEVQEIESIRELIAKSGSEKVSTVNITPDIELEKDFYLNNHSVSQDRKSESLLSQLITNLTFYRNIQLENIDVNKLDGIVNQTDLPILSIMFNIIQDKIKVEQGEESTLKSTLFDSTSKLDNLLLKKYSSLLGQFTNNDQVELNAELNAIFEQEEGSTQSVEQFLQERLISLKGVSAFAQLGITKEWGTFIVEQVGAKTKSRLVQDIEYRASYLVSYTETFKILAKNASKVVNDEDKQKLDALVERLEALNTAINETEIDKEIPTGEEQAKAVDVLVNTMVAELSLVEVELSNIISSMENSNFGNIIRNLFESYKDPNVVALLFKAENYELDNPFMPTDKNSVEALELAINVLGSLRVNNLGEYYKAFSTMYGKDAKKTVDSFTTTFEQQLVLKDIYTLVAEDDNHNKLKTYWESIATMVKANLEATVGGKLTKDTARITNYYMSSKQIRAYYLTKFVRGYAGTGKTTFLTKGIIKLINSLDKKKTFKILVTAPADAQFATIDQEMKNLTKELSLDKKSKVEITRAKFSEIENLSAEALGEKYDMILVDEATLMTKKQYLEVPSKYPVAADERLSDDQKAKRADSSIRDKIRLTGLPTLLIGDEVQTGKGEFGTNVFIGTDPNNREEGNFIPRTMPLVNPMRTGKINSFDIQKNIIGAIVELSRVPTASLFSGVEVEGSKSISSLQKFKGVVNKGNFMAFAAKVLAETLYNAKTRTKYYLNSSRIIEEGVRFLPEGKSSDVLDNFVEHFKFLIAKNSLPTDKNQTGLKLIVLEPTDIPKLKAEVIKKLKEANTPIENINLVDNFIISAEQSQGKSINHAYVYTFNAFKVDSITDGDKLLDNLKRLFVAVSREIDSLTISLPKLEKQDTKPGVEPIESILNYPTSQQVSSSKLIDKFKPSTNENNKPSKDIVARQTSTRELFDAIAKGVDSISPTKKTEKEEQKEEEEEDTDLLTRTIKQGEEFIINLDTGHGKATEWFIFEESTKGGEVTLEGTALALGIETIEIRTITRKELAAKLKEEENKKAKKTYTHTAEQILAIKDGDSVIIEGTEWKVDSKINPTSDDANTYFNLSQTTRSKTVKEKLTGMQLRAKVTDIIVKKNPDSSGSSSLLGTKILVTLYGETVPREFTINTIFPDGTYNISVYINDTVLGKRLQVLKYYQDGTTGGEVEKTDQQKKILEEEENRKIDIAVKDYLAVLDLLPNNEVDFKIENLKKQFNAWEKGFKGTGRAASYFNSYGTGLSTFIDILKGLLHPYLVPVSSTYGANKLKDWGKAERDIEINKALDEAYVLDLLKYPSLQALVGEGKPIDLVKIRKFLDEKYQAKLKEVEEFEDAEARKNTKTDVEIEQEKLDQLEKDIKGKLPIFTLLPDSSDSLTKAKLDENLAAWQTKLQDSVDSTAGGTLDQKIVNSINDNHVKNIRQFIDKINTLLNRLDVSTADGLVKFNVLVGEINTLLDPISNFMTDQQLKDLLVMPSLQELVGTGKTFDLELLKQMLNEKYQVALEEIKKQGLISTQPNSNKLTRKERELERKELLDSLFSEDTRNHLIKIVDLIFKSKLEININYKIDDIQFNFIEDKKKGLHTLSIKVPVGTYNNSYRHFILNEIFNQLIASTSPKLLAYRASNKSNKSLSSILDFKPSEDPLLSAIFSRIEDLITSKELTEQKLNAVITTLVKTSDPNSDFVKNNIEIVSPLITTSKALFKAAEKNKQIIDTQNTLGATKLSKIEQQEAEKELESSKQEIRKALFDYVDTILSSPYFMMIHREVDKVTTNPDGTTKKESLFNFMFENSVLLNIRNKSKTVSPDVGQALSDISKRIADIQMLNLREMTTELDEITKTINDMQNEVNRLSELAPIVGEIDINKAQATLDYEIPPNELEQFLNQLNSVNPDLGSVNDTFVLNCK